MLKFENPINGRYYYLDVQKDLINEHILVVMRGSKLNNHHRIIRISVGHCRASLRKEIDRLSKKRLKRGYLLI
jgi:hypothetical protein